MRLTMTEFTTGLSDEVRNRQRAIMRSFEANPTTAFDAEEVSNSVMFYAKGRVVYPD